MGLMIKYIQLTLYSSLFYDSISAIMEVESGTDG
jgi:hypothetical protein